MDKKSKPEVMDFTKPEVMDFTKLKERYDDCRRASSGWRKKARDWYAMDAGKQWTDEDISEMEEQDRPIITFNRGAPQIDAICGLEVNNRHETTYQPRTIGSVKINEKLTAAGRWVRDQCNAEDEESQVFRDGLICGLGVTETYMDYDTNPQGEVIISRVDPSELYWTNKARKTNLTDAREIFRVRNIDKSEAQKLWPKADEGELNATWSQPDRLQGPSHEITPVGDYGKEGTLPSDTTKRDVTIVEAQWFERRDVYYITDPFTGENKTTEADEFKVLQERVEALQEVDPEQQPLDFVKQQRKTYKRAFMGTNKFLEKGDCPDKNSFTYKFFTVKIDRNTGEPYGLWKIMEDPQKWANKWLAQTMYILNANPKGGVFAEEDAVENWKQFESSYADPATVTKVASGALTSGKIQPKVAPQLPTAMPQLLEFAVTSLPQVTGVSLDAIGLADRNQPGVLEHMRKQSMMTILASVFANLRKYRKDQGRLLLHFIKEYIADGRLIRIGDGIGAKYEQLIREDSSEEYDVVVDESPTSPNQKDQTWLIISQMLPMVSKMPVPPEFWLKIIEYSPLPSSLSDELVKILTQAIQSQPTKPVPFKPTVSIDRLLELGGLTTEERRQLLAKIGIMDPAQQPQQPQGQPGMPGQGMPPMQ